MRPFNKIFGIGLSKTGTHSLTTALDQLGVPTVHWPTSMQQICAFRGATDTTVSCRFKELDQIFSGSLFIYTERDQYNWLRSVAQHFRCLSKQKSRFRTTSDNVFALEADIRIYGGIVPKADWFWESYLKHQGAVEQYFANKVGQLLRIRITEGEGWEKLCTFLDVPVPNVPFPHLGKRRHFASNSRVQVGGARGR